MEEIGKGSFGSVSKVRRKTDGRTLVWKELNYGKMSEKEKQMLVSEVNILRELSHPNIVRYYAAVIPADVGSGTDEEEEEIVATPVLSAGALVKVLSEVAPSVYVTAEAAGKWRG